jgi:hypothetical protein
MAPWPPSSWDARALGLSACARPPTRCQPRAAGPRPGCRGGAHGGLVYRPPPRPPLVSGGEAPQRGPHAPPAGRPTLAWRFGPGAAALPYLPGRCLSGPAPPRAGPPAPIRFAARGAWPASAARPRGGVEGRAGTGPYQCGDLCSRPAPLDSERAHGAPAPYTLEVVPPWPRQLWAGSPPVRRSHLAPRLPLLRLPGPYGCVTARARCALPGALWPRAGLGRPRGAGPRPCPERSRPHHPCPRTGAEGGLVAPGPARAPSNAAGWLRAARTPTRAAARSLPGRGERAGGVGAQPQGGGAEPPGCNAATAAACYPGPATRARCRLEAGEGSLWPTPATDLGPMDLCPTQTPGGMAH